MPIADMGVPIANQIYAVKLTGHRLPHPRHVQEPLIAAVVDELLGRGGPCPSTGVSALRTQRVLDALLSRRLG